MKSFGIFIIGVNHKTASLSQRECVAVSPQQITRHINTILSAGPWSEVVGLSTCNRTEWYVIGPREPGIMICLRTLLNILHDTGVWTDPGLTYVYQSTDAVKHLYQVVSGLDSQMVGESQILGQVKDAFTLAMESNATGTILNNLFQSAFHVGKEVRSKTDIGAGAVSISSAAVELASKIFSNLSRRTALLIGAGETGELTARHLKSQNIKTMYITNRTFEKAKSLARKLGGFPVRYDAFSQQLTEVDIVISATDSMEFTVDADVMRGLMSKRNNRPLFFIDIAVPRDIDPNINKLDNIFVNSIDDLNTIVNKNLKQRKDEIPKAEQIILREVESFQEWLKSLDVKPVIASLHKKFEQLRKAEVEKNRKFFHEDDWEDLEKLTTGLMRKFLHIPMMQLREAAQNGNGELRRIQAAYDLFDLQNEDNEK